MTMISDRDALLHAIAENPGDDTPRLAYADWLDENAAELPAEEHAAKRAEFIRLQVKLARHASDDPEREKVASSVVALLAVYGGEWFPALSRPVVSPDRGDTLSYELAAPTSVERPIERGFVTEITVRGQSDGWTDLAGRSIAVEPVGSLKLLWAAETDGTSLVTALNRWPRADRLRSLALWCPLTTADAAQLAHCPNLVNLRTLHAQPASPGAADALIGPVTARLRRFDFRVNRSVGHSNLSQAAALADLLYHTAAEELTLGNFSDDEAGVFLARVANPSITAISAFELGFRDPTLVALAACPVLPRVRSLDLRANYWSAPAVANFFRTAPLKELRELRASHSISHARERSDEVWRAILAAAFVPRLEVLDVGWRPGLTARDLESVAAGHFPALRVLSVGPGQVGDAGVEALTRGPCAARLKELSLWDCGVTDRGARLIAERFPVLERVDLRNNSLGSAGKARLAARFGPRALI